MEPEYSESPAKNVFSLISRKDGPRLTIRSNFDSGNIAKVEIVANNAIAISPANDCQGTEYESHAKGWFYFGISGAPIGYRQKFIIKRLSQLSNQAKFSDYFKPVFKYGEDCWQRMEQALVTNREDDTELHFQVRFQKASQLFIAYSFPFSFQQNEQALKQYKNMAKQNFKTIYYHEEVMIQSPQSRPIYLLTISSFHEKLSIREAPINEYLFQGKTNRAFKFQESKKIVLISARVHPGQAPSSHTMNGIIKFLLSKDARAQLLRRNFIFKIIPMLNPDGVYNGHYRMDIFNQNLNRFYLNPDPFQQPSAYAIRHLGQYYKLENRLAFYMDLHAHPQRKGNFIYGNAFDSKEQQVETQLFPKVLSLNCVEFDYQNSCFSKNHMTLKDRNEDLTKQGCGRVVFQRDMNQIYSYTMECGYTCSNYLNQLSSLNAPHRKIDRLGIIPDDIDNVKSVYYAGKTYFTIRSYQNLGRCICISILDIFNKNPYSRIGNTSFKTIEGIKQSINEQLMKNAKQIKSYIPKLNGSTFSKQEKKLNRPATFIGKSLNKDKMVLQRKIFTSKFLEKNNVMAKEKIRRRTLPKMRN